MEDFSRKLAKVVKEFTLPKPLKRANSWRVLLLGDLGHIISIKKPKRLAIALAVIFFIAILSSFWLLIVSKKAIEDNKGLRKALDVSRKEVISLRDEKDLLMVRLVMAEAKIKTKDADIPNKSSSIVKTKDADISTKLSLIVKTKDSKAIDKLASLPDKKQVAEKSVTARPEKIQKTAVEDFIVLFEQDTETLNVQFKIINASKSEEPVSGHTFVILKQDEDDERSWQTFPSASLVSGKPASFKKGQYFSIVRFKIIKFKTQNETEPKRFKTAAIFVFDTTGELLLEKSFPVGIKEPAPNQT